MDSNHHDHSVCMKNALHTAHEICESRGVRLTELRLKILELIWTGHKPLGAYTLIEMLSKSDSRRVAPPTVYRALEFLLEQGLIHRINSLNTFIGCVSPPHNHQSYIFICRQCGIALELQQPQLEKQIDVTAKKAGFTIEAQTLEIMGLCHTCQK